MTTSMDGRASPFGVEGEGSTEMSTGSDRFCWGGSDKSTPTNKSSTNSSLSPANINMDYPSPPKLNHQQQQQQQQQQSSLHISPSTPNFINNPSTLLDTNHNIPNTDGQLRPPDTTSYTVSPPATSADPNLSNQNPFALPSGWDVPHRQPHRPEPDNVPILPSSPTMDQIIASLDDVPWQPSHGPINWNEWQG